MGLMRQIQKQIGARKPVKDLRPVEPRRSVRSAAPAAGCHDRPEEMWIELPAARPASLGAARRVRALPNVSRVDLRRMGRWLVATGCALAVDDVRAALEPLGIEVESWFLFSVGGFDEQPRTTHDG